MLKIEKLGVKIKDTDINIIKDLDLDIENGTIHAIMGPNGTGKSTLSKTIMGHYKYEVTKGTIVFNEKDITNMEPDERAREGIFLAMQDPTVIDGVTNSEFLRTALSEVTGEHVNLYSFISKIDKAVKEVKLSDEMIHRSLNKGFSGGEKKKNEVLQLKILEPKLIILDEIDSGLDVDSLNIVCENINNYLKEHKDASVLIITHYPRILEFIKPGFVHIMKNGNIVKTGDFNLALDIEKNGYDSINEVKEVGNNE